VDELEHTLIHYLCVGSMTHSKILELIRSEGKQEATVDEILKKIADYNSCTKEPTKKVYKLKKGKTEIKNNNNKTSC
jgi:K+/H+ antiporter YhaU regulatory subunit KhtT